MSDWLGGTWAANDIISITSVCGCAILLYPLLFGKPIHRPTCLASHVDAATAYVRRFRGAPTGVLSPMSRANLQAASHHGKELSLSKLTFDGLTYASAVSFKNSALKKDRDAQAKAEDGKNRLSDVPHAFLVTERAQVIHAIVTERMAQANDTSMLLSMQNHDTLSRRTLSNAARSAAAYALVSSLAAMHTLQPPCVDGINAAAIETIPEAAISWATFLIKHSPLGSLLDPDVVTPFYWGHAPLAFLATTVFLHRMWVHRMHHLPRLMWERLTHQAAVRTHDRFLTARLSPGAWITIAAATDINALLAISSIPCIPSAPFTTACCLVLLWLQPMIQIGIHFEDEAVEPPLPPPPRIDPEALTLRVLQALELSVLLPRMHATCSVLRPGPETPETEEQEQRLKRLVGREGPLTGSAVSEASAKPWHDDDEESLLAFAAAAQQRPAIGEQALGGAHARLHAERALAVISMAIAETRDAGFLATTALLSKDEADSVHSADEVYTSRSLPRASLARVPLNAIPHDSSVSGALLQSHRMQHSMKHSMLQAWLPSHEAGLRELVRGAERLLDFLGEATADVGALHYHRGVVNFMAARSLQKLERSSDEAEATQGWLHLPPGVVSEESLESLIDDMIHAKFGTGAMSPSKGKPSRLRPGAPVHVELMDGELMHGVDHNTPYGPAAPPSLPSSAATDKPIELRVPHAVREQGQGLPSGNAAAREFLQAAREAFEQALEHTPFCAVQQRGKISSALVLVLDQQEDLQASLRHAAHAAKCLRGDLRACEDAARLWSDAAAQARGADDAATAAALLSIEDDIARAMLFLEEAQHAKQHQQQQVRP